jgi:hypothetical protein
MHGSRDELPARLSSGNLLMNWSLHPPCPPGMGSIQTSGSSRTKGKDAGKRANGLHPKHDEEPPDGEPAARVYTAWVGILVVRATLLTLTMEGYETTIRKYLVECALHATSDGWNCVRQPPATTPARVGAPCRLAVAALRETGLPIPGYRHTTGHHGEWQQRVAGQASGRPLVISGENAVAASRGPPTSLKPTPCSTQNATVGETAQRGPIARHTMNSCNTSR